MTCREAALPASLGTESEKATPPAMRTGHRRRHARGGLPPSQTPGRSLAHAGTGAFLSSGRGRRPARGGLARRQPRSRARRPLGGRRGAVLHPRALPLRPGPRRPVHLVARARAGQRRRGARRRHLGHAFHRDALVHAVRRGALRRGAHDAVDVSRDVRFVAGAVAAGAPRRAAAPAGARRHARGRGHRHHALHGHGGHAHGPAAALRPAVVHRLAGGRGGAGQCGAVGALHAHAAHRHGAVEGQPARRCQPMRPTARCSSAS